MKNLKKVLALVLAFACAFTMFAGAAFTDQADINEDNAEAVELLSALGVIGGYTDGSYLPEKSVTRAEMAKMIYTIRNGGNSNASAYESVATSFTDISGHWAEGYIKYLQSTGIVSGKSAYRFDPDGTVTTGEAMKMALVLAGYRADKAGLTGTQWLNNTVSYATTNGLTKNVTSSISGGCTRQDAAQILSNALYMDAVVWSEFVGDFLYDGTNGMGTGARQTVGFKWMDLVEATGIYQGNEYNLGALSEDEIQVDFTSSTDSEFNDDINNGLIAREVVFPMDLDWIGEEVKVLYKDANNGLVGPDDKDTVYGVYNTGATKVVKATVADIDDDYGVNGRVKIDGTVYNVADSGELYNNYVQTTPVNQWNGVGDADQGATIIEGLEAVNGDTVKFVLNDNAIDAVYVTNTTLNKVTGVSGTKVSLSNIGTIDTAENDTVVYDGIAKDDVVTVTKLYDANNDDATFVIEKAETVTGDLTAFTNTAGDASTKSMTVDGEIYKVYNEAAMPTTLCDDAVAVLDNTMLEENFTLYLVNGYVGAVQQNTEAAVYAVVDSVNTGNLAATFNAAEVKLVFADGSSKKVTLHEDSVLYTNSTAADANHNNTAWDETDVSTALSKGEIVKYTEKADGTYLIEEVVIGANYKRYNTMTNYYNADTKTVNDVVTAGDCVLYYTNEDGDIKVANIRDLDDINVSAQNTSYLTDSDGKVIVVYIDLQDRPSGAISNTLYGIVTTDHSEEKKDGDNYWKYTIATDEGNVDVYLSTESLNKGQLVSFEKSSDDTYTDADFDIYAGTVADSSRAVAVTEYDENASTITYANGLRLVNGAYVAIDKITASIDDDAKIVYIDADNDAAGNSGAGITAFDSVTGYDNVLLIFDNNNKVVGIFVNTNTDTDVLGNDNAVGFTSIELAANPTADEVNAALGRSTAVTIKGNFAPAAAVTVDATKTLTVTGNVDFTTAEIDASAGNLRITGTLKTGDTMPANITNMTAGSIDATAFTAITGANIATLLDHSDKVTVDEVAAGDAAAALDGIDAATKTLTVTGNFTAPTANKNLAGALIVNGTYTTATANTVTIDGSLKVNKLAGTAAQLVGAAGKTIEVVAPDADAMAILESDQVAKAGVIVKLGAAVTGAANKWFDATNDGATAAAADTAVSAGTYTYRAVNSISDGTNNKAHTAGFYTAAIEQFVKDVHANNV